MKAKQIFTIVFLLLNILSIQGQSVLTEGAKWHYNHYQFWQPGYGYNLCSISYTDTIINEKECLIYNRSTGSCDTRPLVEYIYEEDEKLFYYESSLDEFEMLYDFGAEVGDTITIKYWPDFNLGASDDTLFYIQIDSITPFQYGTLELKQFHVTYDPWQDDEIVFSEQYNKGIIIEGIGSLNNFFHLTENGLCDASYNIGLRCFDNPNYELIQFMDIPCNYVPVEDILDEQYIEINPNPFIDKISIKSAIQIKDPVIIVYDIRGDEIMRKKVNGNKKLDEVLDMSNYPEAIYILNIYENKDSSKLRYAKKIVKIR